MSRSTDTLLQGKAFSSGYQQPMLNPQLGGQNGFSVDLREYINNANYVPRNVFALLVEAPAIFQKMKDPDVWTGTLRSMVELHPRSIEGLQMGLTVETADTPVGGAGEVQEEVVNVTRARSTPTFVWNEKVGRPFGTLLNAWITYGLMDPNSKIANIATIGTNRPTDMLPDQYAMSVMFIEPDATHTKVVRAWLITNMFPKSDGTQEGKRDLTSALQLQELSIEFTALTQVGLGVNATAQKMLDAINITNANPNLRQAFLDAVTADVAKTTKGYAPGITSLAGNVVTA